MLFEIMKHIRNYFPTPIQRAERFTIKDGTASLPFVKEGQYILIEDSAFNNGVFQYPLEGLTDETFDGVITVLAPPKLFLNLVAEIEDFQKDYNPSAFTSESFGGYSYSRATNSKGNIAGWQDVFKTRLNAWRKI